MIKRWFDQSDNSFPPQQVQETAALDLDVGPSPVEQVRQVHVREREGGGSRPAREAREIRASNPGHF